MLIPVALISTLILIAAIVLPNEQLTEQDDFVIDQYAMKEASTRMQGHQPTRPRRLY